MMRNSIKYLSSIMLVLSVLSATLQAADVQNLQTRLVVDYFAHELNTTSEKIEVDVIHASRIDPALLEKGQIEVQSGHSKFNLGHQTLWLVHKVDGIIKKRYPITIEVHAKLQVPTAIRNIQRQDIISQELIENRLLRVGREYSRVILKADDIYDKMATQVIHEGSVFERNMVRFRPDVLRGDELHIILKNQGLSLELSGIAKEEGRIGEEIRVQCPATRKEFKGILENSKAVTVNLR